MKDLPIETKCRKDIVGEVSDTKDPVIRRNIRFSFVNLLSKGPDPAAG